MKEKNWRILKRPSEHVSISQPDIFFTTVAYPIKGTPYYKTDSRPAGSVQPWANKL